MPSYLRSLLIFGLGVGMSMGLIQRASKNRLLCATITMRKDKDRASSFDRMKLELDLAAMTGKKWNNVVPKNIRQYRYMKDLQSLENNICVGVGSPGTGKTLFACNVGAEMLDRKIIDRIIVTRPLVTVCNENIGFLPGTLNKKMDPWMLPIMDIFEDYYSKKEVARMVHAGIIDVVPLGFMRGRTFKRAWIIADELQNATKDQVMMLMTRIGDDSKMVITGDLSQSDLGPQNGLADLLSRIAHHEKVIAEKISVVQFLKEDVERSAIVKLVLDLYQPNSSSD